MNDNPTDALELDSDVNLATAYNDNVTITIDELIAYLRGIRMSQGNLPVLSLAVHPDDSCTYFTIPEEPNFAVANPDSPEIGDVYDVKGRCTPDKLPNKKVSHHSLKS